MIAYKGFNKDLTCRGFQYRIGETYKIKGGVARCTINGFHSCENPLDIFSYYPPSDSVFHIVDIGGEIDRGDDVDSKIASSEITIKEEIELPELITRSVEWTQSRITKDKSPIYQSSASNTGDMSSASNTGDRSSASNAGYRSSASNTGDGSAASNTGDMSSASNTGYRSAASNTGDMSSASNTGDRSAASNTGGMSVASNTGDRSSASNTGGMSVAMASGRGSKAKACIGSAIVLVYRDYLGGLIHIKSAIVDGKKLKGDTYYELTSNGEFEESK